MLNTFPYLLLYSQFGPMILRIVLGLILVDLGFLKLRGERSDWIKAFEAIGLKPAKPLVSLYGLLEIIGGALLLVGLWTQPAALAFVIFSGIEFYLEYQEGSLLKRDLVFYLLIFAIALSLLFTGAGAFAIDLPL